MDPREPVHVIPIPLGDAVADIPYWFVIGGQAVRCFCPYRPSRDVDFGVVSAADLDDLVYQLEQRGQAVFRQDVNDGLLLRALTYFDDAEREAKLPGEGPDDWATVREFFWTRVGQLPIPPARKLAIQGRVVDVTVE